MIGILAVKDEVQSLDTGVQGALLILQVRDERVGLLELRGQIRLHSVDPAGKGRDLLLKALILIGEAILLRRDHARDGITKLRERGRKGAPAGRRGADELECVRKLRVAGSKVVWFNESVPVLSNSSPKSDKLCMLPPEAKKQSGAAWSGAA